MANTVASIVVSKLIDKINTTGRLPWDYPFVAPCMNWYSKHEYRGINKLLLAGGEYISPNQLKKYNESNKTDFWFKAGTPYEIAVFYSVTEKEMTPNQISQYVSGKLKVTVNIVNGKYYLVSFVLKYHRIYSIDTIFDKEGNTLTPHLGNTMVNSITPVDDLVSYYCDKSGVRVFDDGHGGCYYSESDDGVHTPKKRCFNGTEEYYRVLFHELIHSTGIKSRLARTCFADYHKGSKERSKEELVAEVGSILLSTECGFVNDVLTDASENYVANWCKWMKDNDQDVVNGMLAAEKAMQYIRLGCDVSVSEDEKGTAVSKIGDKKEVVINANDLAS